MESLELATHIARILDTRKAQEVKVLKVRDLTVLTDCFVIASGSSSTQVKSLAEDVEFFLEHEGIRPLRTEGYDTKNWILLDYGEVIVHIFYPQAREFYDLEHLWADADHVELDFSKDLLKYNKYQSPQYIAELHKEKKGLT